jgi:hypothetical protein
MHRLGYGSIGGEAEDLLRELSVSGEEIIGQQQEEILGDEDYVEYSHPQTDLVAAEEIIGAMPTSRGKNMALQALRAARSKIAPKTAGASRAPALPTQGTRVEVMPQVNRRHRLMIAGMGQTVVALGAPAVITIAPQRLFKPKLMSFPGSIAAFFGITAVFVGQDSQLAAAGMIPCECFTETAVNAPIDWDTANIGNTITINIQNIEPAGGAASRTFMGMLIGLGVKP